MSIFICDNCDQCVDADYKGCYENPNDECGCLCENCYDKLPKFEG